MNDESKNLLELLDELNREFVDKDMEVTINKNEKGDYNIQIKPRGFSCSEIIKEESLAKVQGFKDLMRDLSDDTFIEFIKVLREKDVDLVWMDTLLQNSDEEVTSELVCLVEYALDILREYVQSRIGELTLIYERL